nr:MAG TPA: hypothetical protein [Bacteriophage sp.]
MATTNLQPSNKCTLFDYFCSNTYKPLYYRASWHFYRTLVWQTQKLMFFHFLLIFSLFSLLKSTGNFLIFCHFWLFLRCNWL